MTVDPAKLTDINLLKRHVLKRCIYGVDLNPMAVELAKVSLWLDAFTLGAPLNFLDHHLRCGNSLVGATFKDLEEATAGRLFRHRLRAAAAGDQSRPVRQQDGRRHRRRGGAVGRRQYDQARRDLSGYRSCSTCWSPSTSACPQAQELVTHGLSDLDLTTASDS